MYVTPDKFRTMRTGNDLDLLQDVEIAEVLDEASAVIDGYCSIPTIPQRHDFRGGSIVGEDHQWRIPRGINELGSRRAYPFHFPIKIAIDGNGNPLPQINSFKIYVTNTQYVDIAPSDLFVQNSERYVEVVSLAITSSGLFNALIIPNVGLATPTVRMDYDYGYLFGSDADERLYPTDALTYRARNQWWDSSVVPVVKQNGSAVSSSNYDVDYNEGTITFHTAIAPDEAGTPDKITCTYSYRLPSEIMRATGLIAAYLLGDADLTAKGMAGLQTISFPDGARLQRARSYGTIVVDDLDAQVPLAATLLAGYKFWRAAA